MTILLTGIDIIADLYRLWRAPDVRYQVCFDVPDRFCKTTEKDFAIGVDVKLIVTHPAFDFLQESSRIFKIALKG